MSELTGMTIITAHNADPGGASFDSTDTASSPLSGEIYSGTGGYDRILFNAFTVGLTADLTTNTVQETGTSNTATFSGYESVVMGSGQDIIRWGIDATAFTTPYRFDGGDSAFDTFRISSATLGNGQTITGVDLNAGCVIGEDNGTEIDLAYLENLEWLTLDISGNMAITGNDEINVITLRGTGNDTIQTLGGNDQISAGAGNDTIDGGEGEDTVLYQDATGGVTAYLMFDGRNVGGGMGADTFISIENLYGSDFGDRLVGDTNGNELFGYGGNDVLKGKGGDDTIGGFGGNDRLIAGSGSDLMSGGDGEDILIALDGDDTLNGNNDRDFVYGGRGNDIVRGGMGDDEVRGNRGNDNVFGDEGNDDVRGGGGNDILEGGLGDDFLFGENGSDVVFGDSGNDVMTGGVGTGIFDGAEDTFVYAPDGGFDRIKDFENGIDLISLSPFGFSDFNTQVAPLASDTASGMRLDFGSGNVLFIENFSVADFDSSDVLLTF